MGPTWIVVIVRRGGETSSGEFTNEDAAREAYDAARKESGRTVYLAVVRSESES